MKTVIVMVFAALAATQLTGCGGDKADTAGDTAGSPVDTAAQDTGSDTGDTQDTSAQDTGADTGGDTADTAAAEG
jgi:hypothetical protein